MIELFIPYEESLQLKDLGFDKPCFGYYNNKGDLTFNTNNNPVSKDWVWYGNELLPTDMVLAPIFSQAFKWFREKYPELDFGIGKIYNGISNYHFHINLQWEFFEGTYEEAELACLRKLIQIVKNEIQTNQHKNKRRNTLRESNHRRV